ncbi:AMP-binding enzyme [Kibdelosporangium aridum]|uniref:AMP-binding enzyme n=2 Tax=Kibdelosporangium aridum TaxID=2030 RepID=A0A1Y5Y868_KIBAR|nr:AMP-binding enzyme [Kibdelosporangium aridum]
MLKYAGTHAWAMRLADGLIASGIRPGDHVGLIVANHLEFVPLKFAIAAAGAIAVPFDYVYRQDGLAYVFAQSGCSVLITMTSFGDLDYPAMLDAIALGWANGSSEKLPSLPRGQPGCFLQGLRAPLVGAR